MERKVVEKQASFEICLSKGCRTKWARLHVPGESDVILSTVESLTLTLRHFRQVLVVFGLFALWS